MSVFLTYFTPAPPGTAAVSSASTGDLLDLDVALRSDQFRFDLLDQAHNPIGTLHPTLDQPPRVRFDTTRGIFRTMSSVLIAASTLADVDPLTDRVRPVMVLQNGAEFPLGVLMFGQDVRSPRSWGTVWTPELFDETFIVDQPLDAPISISPGESILAKINATVAEVGLPDVDFSDVVDAHAGAPFLRAAGSSRAQAVAAMFQLLGYYPPYFDNAGTYRARPAPTAAAGADHSYNLGGSIIADSITTTNNSYRSPNRYQVVGGDANGSIVGTYDIPDSAPNSYARTGRRIVDSQQPQGVPSVEVANLIAYINALTDRNTYVTAQFSSGADPRHGAFDLVSLLGVQMQETAWEIECRSGGPMTHNLGAWYP